MNKTKSHLSVLLTLFCLVFTPLSFAATQHDTANIERVNINTASIEQLSESLAGIGPQKASAIIEWRTRNGNFTDTKQLAEIKGIGEAIIERNKERIQL